MSLVKLLWGIILAVGLSLLANLLFYLIEELFKNEKAGLDRLFICLNSLIYPYFKEFCYN